MIRLYKKNESNISYTNEDTQVLVKENAKNAINFNGHLT